MNHHEPINLVFVCVKNGGKSQIAGAFARQLLGSAAIITTAGTSPGAALNAEAVRVLEERGASVIGESPKQLTHDMVVRAHRVIVLGAEAVVEPLPGMVGTIDVWHTDEPSLRGIQGDERMRLVCDDIASRVAELVMELTGQQLSRYRQVIGDLEHRFEGVFSPEDVSAAVWEAHRGLYRPSALKDFLPVLVDRFARELLVARAQANGTQAKARPELLFVCVHNAGRSQLAAALAKRLSGGRVNVRTAGSDPGEQINPAVRAVLEERGMSLDDEFPKPLTNSVLRAADVIITMGCGDTCPFHPGQRREDWPVADPADASLAAVRAIADDIQIRVTRLLGELLNDK